jgi:hypothetical protein
MLEENNPDIDVDALMARVQHEVLRRQFGEPAVPANALGTIDIGAVEGLISAASQRASPRNRWPARLNFFPFSLSPYSALAYECSPGSFAINTHTMRRSSKPCAKC